MTYGTVRSWVDNELLAGDAADVCLRLGEPVTRRELRQLVAEREQELAAAGLSDGGTVTLHLPPSLAYVASLLAGWRIGAQVSLLDHRLARAEVDRALDRLNPQVVIGAAEVKGSAMSGYRRVVAQVTPRPAGQPAATPHALIQLSSGSTGPSKVIARTSQDLLDELGRYALLADYPKAGERIVLLSSIVHVLGLVGGLLHSLHAQTELVFPDRLTADGIQSAVTAGTSPAMLLGVPFHAEMLTVGARPLPQLTRMVVAGELSRPWLRGAFTKGYDVPLGTMYGMTELGVIATDLAGEHAPALTPAPGIVVREEAGELLLKMAASPYIGLVDDTRWMDGWLHTRDAATVDPATGRVTILGRRDSQISIGGLKVDLTEVEQTICELDQVTAAVVSYKDGIEAYIVLGDGAGRPELEAALADQLAPYKRPRRLYLLADLPRTATGKAVRDRTVLQAAAAAPQS
jgi:3-hydroxy-4-methylanthranilate adenylyltransferase